MSSLTLPYIPAKLITRKEALDYCTKEMFSASGNNDVLAMEGAIAMYRSIENCPDSYFEEDVDAFEVLDFWDCEIKFYIRSLCYLKDQESGSIDIKVRDRCRTVLGRIEEMLIEIMSPTKACYIDICLLTVMPTSF